MAKMQGDEKGYGLCEALASMAVLTMAAALFTGGMLGALRLQTDARQRRSQLSCLERAVTEEEGPEKYKDLNLTIVFGGTRLDTRGRLEIYESEDEKLSLNILVPKTGRKAGSMPSDEE